MWDKAVGFGVEIPFVEHLGFELNQFADGHSEITYTARAEHLNSFSVTHGCLHGVHPAYSAVTASRKDLTG